MPKNCLAISKNNSESRNENLTIVKFLITDTHSQVFLNQKKDEANLGNIFEVRIKNDDYILKRHKQSRKIEEIKFEHEFILHVLKGGVPAAEPYRLSNKKYIFAINNNFYSLYKKAKGKRLSIGNIGYRKFRSIIETQVKMHNLAGNFRPNHYKKRRDLFAFGFEEKILKSERKSNLLQPFGEDIKILKSTLGPWEEKLTAFVIHNDLSSTNIFFKGDEIVNIIDFDDCSFGTRIGDLANAIFDFVCNKSGLDFNRSDMLIKQYDSFSRLSSDEKKLIPILILRRLVNAVFYSYINRGYGRYYEDLFDIYFNLYKQARKRTNLLNI